MAKWSNSNDRQQVGGGEKVGQQRVTWTISIFENGCQISPVRNNLLVLAQDLYGLNPQIPRGKFSSIMKNFTLLLFLCSALLLISILITCAAAVDTIRVNQTIKDGETIVSAGDNFELGFFSPGASKNRYVGILYKKISTSRVVWVANTEAPLTNTSGVLQLNQGGLQLFDGNNTLIWSTNSSASVSLEAQLLNTGNLVLQDRGSLIWQSFDYPGDTLLPGMRIGIDLITGKDRHLTSWKSDDDPSEGQYVLRVDPNGYPQLLEKQNLDPWSRFGPWNGITFNGMPNLGEDLIFSHQFVINETEIYYEYMNWIDSLVSRMHLSPDGKIEYWNWIDHKRSWNRYSTATIDNCARYGICGPYGVCNINNAPACSCMDGFQAQRPEQWDISDWSSGCQRIKPLACGNGDGFRKMSGVKFPDTNHSWYNQSMTIGECEVACKTNCSCTAYARLDIRNGGSGCLLWFNDLMDLRIYDEIEELYVRMPASELTTRSKLASKRNRLILGFLSGFAGIMAMLLVFLYRTKWLRKTRLHRTARRLGNARNHQIEIFIRNYGALGPKRFKYLEIKKMTNSFLEKLGQGGYGSVYKGQLPDGQLVAVKLLSEATGDGEDFINEVASISKTSHVNIVSLLGFCIEGDKRALLYEFMPNGSLDKFLRIDGSRLEWNTLFLIAKGIARGLEYLHRGCNTRIVHFDIKPHNILLDEEFIPKISDFGLAKLCKKKESIVSVMGARGTVGYMAPEVFFKRLGGASHKSDVYSYGMMVLEMAGASKNLNSSLTSTSEAYFPDWIYKQVEAGDNLGVHGLTNEVEEELARKMVTVSLWCIQSDPLDRPSISKVLEMFEGSFESLQVPPRLFWSSPERLAQGTSTSAMQSLTSEGISIIQAAREDLSS